MIPPLIKRIASSTAERIWRENYNIIYKRCDIEDFQQIIYEKLWEKGLWNCKVKILLYRVSYTACIDWLRADDKGYRRGKAIIGSPVEDFNQSEVPELIYDYESYNDLISYKTLVSDLSGRERYFAEKYLEGDLLWEIGEDLGITESAVSQIKKKVVRKLKQKYNKGNVYLEAA